MRNRLVGGAGLWLLVGCGQQETPAESTYYEREIAPIVQASCAASATGSGCHVFADEHENALGNLSFESYAALALRRDLLVDYGPYQLPGLLLKAVPPQELTLSSWDGSELRVRTDIPHAGGALLDFTSVSFSQLEKWLERGAAENNARWVARQPELTPCSEELGSDPEFDPSVDPGDPDFADFEREVNPVLVESCAAGNCHGSPSNQLHLTCGSTPEEVRWNYFAASGYVSSTPTSSEILRRTLAPARGGTYHEGGVIFEAPSEPGYDALLRWVRAKGGPSFVPEDEGFRFFTTRVEPMLVKRGCMLLGCHSPAMFHDYRLRGGSGGHFGLPATRTNYRLSLEQVALESPDPNVSRLIRKNLPSSAGGIVHRGGALFAGGGDPAACDPEAAERGDLDEVTPYCVLATWIAKERERRLEGVLPLSAVVYVRRPRAPGPDRPQDFESYAPGAELVRRAAAWAPGEGLTVTGAEESLSALCGLDVSASDVRRPAVSWDGRTIAFAAREAEHEPWRIYVVEGETCAVEPSIDAPAVDERGAPVPTNRELVHNFDPTFAPDGRLVFASTRGNVMNTAAFSYAGPQRTPADPSKLNANLYILEGGAIRQLTFLLNQELAPAFMNDGRLLLVLEKRAPDFYQLAGRRLNLDGGDAHPLFGQRATIGYDQLSEVVELADKNFAAILSDRGARYGAGALGVINRSLGVDQRSERPEDYLQSPEAIDWPNPEFYQRSLRLVDPDASGKLGGTRGAYRNPSPLPDGNLLVSYAPDARSIAEFDGNFDVYVVDPASGARRPLIEGASDELWPVAVFGRAARPVFRSRRDEVNGATRVFDDPERRPYAEVTYLDLPLLTSLLFQNTRGPARFFDANASHFEFWESLPPEAGVTDYGRGGEYVMEDRFGPLYVRRRPLGAVRPYADGSAKVLLPGGVPIVLSVPVQLAGDQGTTQHFQREEVQFYPGEWVRQSFRRELFNGVCAGCHGAVNGLESHVAIRPDILTSASAVEAATASPKPLTPRGDAQGPPFP